MFIVFNFAFNFWHTINAEGLKQQVQRGAITADEFKQITNIDYVA